MSDPTAVVELCFAVVERSLEALAIAEGGDELRDFQTDAHGRCYDRTARFGLLSREVAQELKNPYENDRADSYYGGRRPTARQAEAMSKLAREIHKHVVGRVREAGVCSRAD